MILFLPDILNISASPISEVIFEQGIRIEWFDAVSNLSGILHAFYYDKTNNLFKYATNSLFHDFDKDGDVEGEDLSVFINTKSDPISNEELNDFASNFGQFM